MFKLARLIYRKNMQNEHWYTDKVVLSSGNNVNRKKHEILGTNLRIKERQGQIQNRRALIKNKYSLREEFIID